MIRDMNLTTDWLQTRAAASPEALALVVASRRYTFRQLDRLASRLVAFLVSEGIAPGDHVGTLLPNSLAMVVTIFALARLRAVLVPLNTRLTPAEWRWQLTRADCAHLLGAAGDEKATRAGADCRLPFHALPVDPGAFEEWLSGPIPERTFELDGAFDALQAIVFTSGTTGFPKGAMISYANHFWSAVGSAFRLGVVPGERWLACLPLYHVGGLAVVFRSCLYGTTVVLHDGFDAAAVLSSLREEAITIVSLVPTMLGRLLRGGLSRATAPHLRLILLGGAVAPPDMLNEAEAVGVPVATTYGLTEAASQVATRMPDEEPRKPGSAGRPLLFHDVAIQTEDGGEAAVGELGEIVVSGPAVMAGYYSEPEATAAVLQAGRLHTGDIGYRDADGDLWVLDRRADLIVSGGENVYPAEVERVLRQYPGVAAACVVGLPHDEWGAQVAAVVVPEQPGVVSREGLLAFSRGQLAGYKQPRVIAFVEQLPLTASGKVQRRAVIEQLLALQEMA
jgi:O-succinylbenzoic acid--CoA ligase